MYSKGKGPKDKGCQRASFVFRPNHKGYIALLVGTRTLPSDVILIKRINYAVENSVT